MTNPPSALEELRNIVRKLLSPEGCPWDREQTPLTLCEYVLEEGHELTDAIRHGSEADVREEMGDLLFLLVFLGVLYEKAGRFSLEDSLRGTAAKMIRRHPHVFADTVFGSRDEQLAAWETIKRGEKADEQGVSAGVFDSLPRSLPPLLKAYRIHSKAARAGFTWENDEDVEQQVEAEWLELLEAVRNGDKQAQEHELGDLILTLVELGRRKGIKASAALDSATHRFLTRFASMEDAARGQGRDFSELAMDEKNGLWDAAKAREKNACACPEEASE